jgi:ATP-dependent Clp protease ATP-binding subunit ClpB
VFHSLSEDHLIKIVEIQLNRLRTRLAERHIQLELTAEAARYLVHVGYDSAYGARPLKRSIQKNIETPIGRLLLQGVIREGQTIRIGYEKAADKMTFTPQLEPSGHATAA